MEADYHISDISGINSNIAKWHYWNQATNSRAQVLAKQRYCAAYPKDDVCTPFEGGQSPVNYYAWGTFIWQSTGYSYVKAGDIEQWRSAWQITGPISGYEVIKQDGSPKVYFYRPDGTSTYTARNWARYLDSTVYYRSQPENTYRQIGKDFKVIRFVRADGKSDTSGNPPHYLEKIGPKKSAVLLLLY